MKRLINVLMVAGIFMSSAFCLVASAEGTNGGAPKAVKEKPTLTAMTLTGKVTKEEQPGKEGKAMVHYILTDAAGNTFMLPGAGKHGKHRTDEQATSVNLEEFIDKDVTIVGKGFQKEKEGKKTTRLVEITKIEATAKPAAPTAQ